MKIAFTSCMSPNSYSRQVVWEKIAMANPDVLVLLGDSVYIDCPPFPDPNGNAVHPSDDGYRDEVFAQHLHALYQKQLAVPEFRTLLQKPGLKTFAIWDDHDFLWNDANGQIARTHKHMNKAVLSSNLFQLWRKSLNGADFPARSDAPEVTKNLLTPADAHHFDAFMPGYTHIELAEKIHLHLTDGRSWRTSKTLLGPSQRDQMEAVVMTQTPTDAIHLVASGSTFSQYGIEGWKDFPVDHDWMLNLASERRVMMLSGDIHRTAAPSPIPTKTGRYFYEITASGAAVNFNPFHWGNIDSGAKGWLNYSQKFGLIHFQDSLCTAQLFDHQNSTVAFNGPIQLSDW